MDTKNSLGLPLWRLLPRRQNAIVPLIEGTHPLPFYWVHSASGDVTSYWKLARAIGANLQFYGIQVVDDLFERGFTPSIEAIAKRYVRLVGSLQPEGPLVDGRVELP
jgi:hypothetical protein